MGGTGDLKCPAQAQGPSPLPQPRAAARPVERDAPRGTCWVTPPAPGLSPGRDPTACAQGARSPAALRRAIFNSGPMGRGRSSVSAVPTPGLRSPSPGCHVGSGGPLTPGPPLPVAGGCGKQGSFPIPRGLRGRNPRAGGANQHGPPGLLLAQAGHVTNGSRLPPAQGHSSSTCSGTSSCRATCPKQGASPQGWFVSARCRLKPARPSRWPSSLTTNGAEGMIWSLGL